MVIELKTLIDKLTGSPTKLRLLTSDEDTQDGVDALSEDTPSFAIGNNPLDDSMSCTSLTVAWVEVLVSSMDSCDPAVFETVEFHPKVLFSQLHGARHYV